MGNLFQDALGKLGKMADDAIEGVTGQSTNETADQIGDAARKAGDAAKDAADKAANSEVRLDAEDLIKGDRLSELTKEEVMALQQNLMDLGYAAGGVDGAAFSKNGMDVMTNTKKALIKFAEDNGLELTVRTEAPNVGDIHIPKDTLAALGKAGAEARGEEVAGRDCSVSSGDLMKDASALFGAITGNRIGDATDCAEHGPPGSTPGQGTSGSRGVGG